MAGTLAAAAIVIDASQIGGATVAVNEEILLRKPFCELIRFHRDTPRHDPKVLVVAPMSGHFATLLRGTVEAFLPDHDVYITDWADAREVPASASDFDLDDYIDQLVDWFRLLGPDLHVMAVCQPAVPVIAAVSCNPATFARDARILIDGGYKLTAATPIDQFRYSLHVEIAARFEK